ncbi:MCE family protein [Nocardioides massiliensis]|uniref:Virulence factor Mce-like protein n=1 Tax=Nocardioides massiliensis TaxID=1325935 RepID=A0ABT9NPK7_9ACTN|nr:MCE family protein [Nocardioides massiliensis]MDP9822357.1 virulence factor Mce-like protein [Nocardioides massiliensis]
MTSLLFTRSAASPARLRLRLLLIGACGLAVLGVLGGLLGLSYVGVLTSDVHARAQLLTTGDSLGVGSDVKYRGLRVGRVLRVRPGTTPEAEVVLMREHLDALPTDVRARVLPATLFGNEYVDLVPPQHPVTRTGGWEDGTVIAVDDSARTVRLMDTFSDTQRLLAAVDPAQLQGALAQLARALDGRGTDLGDFVAQADAVLTRWQQREPALYADLELLAADSRLLADLEPVLVDAVRDSIRVARTLAAQEEALATSLTNGRRLVAAVGDTLAAESQRLVRFLRASAATFAVFAQRHPSFELLLSKVPALLDNGAKAVSNGRIQMEGVLGPQLLDPYDADDCPRYRDLPGKNCRAGGGR